MTSFILRGSLNYVMSQIESQVQQDEQARNEKLREEAENRDRDIDEGWKPND